MLSTASQLLHRSLCSRGAAQTPAKGTFSFRHRMAAPVASPGGHTAWTRQTATAGSSSQGNLPLPLASLTPSCSLALAGWQSTGQGLAAVQTPGPAFVSQPPSSMQQRLTQQQQPGHQQQQTAGYYDVSTSDSESGSDSGPLRVPLKLVVQDAVKRWFNETLSEVCEEHPAAAAAVLGRLLTCRRAPDTTTAVVTGQRTGGGGCSPHTDSAAPAFVCACVCSPPCRHDVETSSSRCVDTFIAAEHNQHREAGGRDTSVCD